MSVVRDVVKHVLMSFLKALELMELDVDDIT